MIIHGGIVVSGPRFLGEIDEMWDSVLNTTGVMVRARSPMHPLPRYDWVNESLVLFLGVCLGWTNILIFR